MRELNFFDLHCDTLTESLARGETLRENNLQLALKRLPKDLHLAETYAIFIPDTLRGQAALHYFLQCAAFWRQQMQENSETLLPVTIDQSVTSIWNCNRSAALLSVEGGAVLGGDSRNVALLKEHGVWMMTLTWNGENELGGGAYVSGGLSAFGREILPLLEEKQIVIDVSHLNDETFWDVLSATKQPIVASHSDSREVCSVPRNLTDDQFRAITERGGLVGLNFFSEFLRDTPETANIEDILRHAEHFLALGGEDVVALGSDFDGADMPIDLPNAQSLPILYEKMIAEFGKTLADKICYKNALDFTQCFAAK